MIQCPVPDLVYVVQTSGTSGGVRKTVFVGDTSISSNVDDFDRIFQLEPTDKIFAAAPPTFDPFYVDLLLAVKKRCVLVFVPAAVKFRSEALARVLFERRRVNFMQMTPSMFRSISKPAEKVLRDSNNFVKFVVLGGEPFPSDPLPVGLTQFFNVYGVTEMSCWQTMTRVKIGSSGALTGTFATGLLVSLTFFSLIIVDGRVLLDFVELRLKNRDFRVFTQFHSFLLGKNLMLQMI